MVDFTPTEAEQKVIDAARTGGIADFRVRDEKADDPANAESWGPERTIRAEVIWALCTGSDERWKVHPIGVVILGARIVGTLNFEGATIICRLGLSDCSFERGLVLQDARARTINLAGSHVPGISADRVNVDGSFFLHKRFQSKGEIHLLGAEIRGDLALTGASLSNPKADALSADRAKIRGNVFLRAGFKADGGIRLLGAEIGGDLDCSGAEVSNPDGNSISADKANIGGSVFLTDGFNAEGAVRLPGADISGNLECAGAVLSNAKGDALVADKAKVGGSIFLSNGFKSAGGVRFIGAEIGGDLNCAGAGLSNPDGNALSADGAKIGGSIFLSDGFESAGGVRFIGAEIGGQVSFRGATFNNGTKIALDLERTQVAGSLIIDSMLEPPVGTVDLSSASVGVLVDDLVNWPAEGQLVLDGFNYATIGGAAPTDARARLEWLRRQPSGGYRPQPYEQLIRVLRAMGHERDAREIAIAKQRASRKHELQDRVNEVRNRLLSNKGNLKRGLAWVVAGLSRAFLYGMVGTWNFVLDFTIKYGYKTWRVLPMMLAVVLFGWYFVFLEAKREGAMTPSKEGTPQADWILTPNGRIPPNYPRLKPFVYSLDVFLPIIDFQQKSYWMPNENTPFGRTVRVYWMIHEALGWLLTTLAVVGFTGLVKKD